MKTTYYFGAGASYNAIPIVGELEGIFRRMEIETARFTDEFQKAGLMNAYRKFQAHMQTGKAASKMFGTIDTYAKKLWLTNDHDLKALKQSLSLFFTNWQEIDKDIINASEVREAPFENIDHRYLGLFANYLEKKDGNISLNKDLKMITWNYDSQLERALKIFTDSNSIEDTMDRFHVYPFDYDHTSPNIVHLNGIAGLYTQKGKNQTQTCYEKNQNEKSVLNVFLNSLYTLNSDEITNDRYFTFAWEDDPFSIKAIEHAEKILKETELLVIIGYSFPTFNDQIDKRLFQIVRESSKCKMVYYQDPVASEELLVTRFGLNPNKITILTKNMTQFALPLDSHNVRSGKYKFATI